MSVGDRVKHSRLGDGIILELCKYEMALVDFSDTSGVLVRKTRLIDLEKRE
jgi:hypothetical protein